MILHFRPALMTAESIVMTDWKGTEWFGTEYAYAPYWDVNDYHTAYGFHTGERVSIEVGSEVFFLCVYKQGEFLCSFEPSVPIYHASVLELTNLSLISEHKGLRRAFCPSE